MKEINRSIANILFAATAAYAGLSAGLAQQEDQSWLHEKKEILRHMTIVELDDGVGGTVPAIRVSGINLQIVNGLGATNGNPSQFATLDPKQTKTNGVGNLIVGYNEAFTNPFGPAPARTGSHNIVGGVDNAYTSYGGVVLGEGTSTSAPFSSVFGGMNNSATGTYSIVIGGGGFGGTVAGNIASGDRAIIVGGSTNEAKSQLSFIGGGGRNKTQGTMSGAVLGGFQNIAMGASSVVCGGSKNRALGSQSCVSGGQARMVSNENNWRAGGLFQGQ